MQHNETSIFVFMLEQIIVYFLKIIGMYFKMQHSETSIFIFMLEQIIPLIIC